MIAGSVPLLMNGQVGKTAAKSHVLTGRSSKNLLMRCRSDVEFFDSPKFEESADEVQNVADVVRETAQRHSCCGSIGCIAI